MIGPDDEIRSLTAEECKACLNEVTPKIGNYGWVWSLIRARSRRHGGLFPWKMYKGLRRYFNPKKPYFIFQTETGVSFVGDCRDEYSVQFACLPKFDESLLQFLKQKMQQRSGTYVDVGANFGIVSATVAQSLRDGESAIAFEPIPATVKRAAATLALNNLTNVKLFPVAVGDKEGILTLSASEENSALASVAPTGEHATNWQSTQVRCVTLDSLWRANLLPNVSFMKIDVEGYELNVLRGASEMIAQTKPTLLYEYNYGIAPKLGWTAEDAAGVIRSASDGYQFHIFQHDGSLTEYPPKQSNLQEDHVDILCEPR